jgi:glutamyl-Q tRNA(Asp) synthetase
MAVYIGRFAPSPTGPLHYGSLVAALASYLDARHARGKWLLRIEDLDPPRESATAPKEIIHQLEAFGFKWDGEVLYQSTRLANYESTLNQLQQAGKVFPCICTRKTTPTVYPGTCRSKSLSNTEQPYAIRLRLDSQKLAIEDRVFGSLSWSPLNDVGDFIIKRKDGLFAYQLAVVVDDIYQRVSHIVRGADLLDSTPRQLAVYNALDAKPPAYLHIPILVDAAGDKLSKQSHAAPVDISNPLATLQLALRDLGQDQQTASTSVSALLTEAAIAWRVDAIPQQMKLTSTYR